MSSRISTVRRYTVFKSFAYWLTGHVFIFTERCSAIGQIFAINAPCQAAVNDEWYCPPPGPTCICPANEVQSNYAGSYHTEEIVNGETTYVWHEVPLMRCVNENFFPFVTSAPG